MVEAILDKTINTLVITIDFDIINIDIASFLHNKIKHIIEIIMQLIIVNIRIVFAGLEQHGLNPHPFLIINQTQMIRPIAHLRQDLPRRRKPIPNRYRLQAFEEPILVQLL